jgi:hypothetical protein
MRNWSFKCWRWLQARITSNGRGSHGARAWRREPVSVVAAQVEQLESRALLTVTYHGGALLPHVEAQAVYLGSDWQNNSSLQTQTGQVDTYLATLVNSPYMDMMTNAGYNVGRGTASAGSVDNIALNKTTGITDAQIQADIQAMITAGKLQAPDANRLYVVYVEPGVVVHLGSDASNTTFLGYHGAFAGKNASGTAIDIHYAVIPYPGAPNFSASSQGFASNFDEMTAVTSHELAEAVTDPNVNYKALGWYDDQLNGEIGDLAEGNYANLSGYVVQDLVNKNDQLISPTTQQTPPPPSSLGAPVVTAKAVSATVAQLSWGAITGAQSYNVYLVVGSQASLLGSVSGSTTSVQVTGLTPGFKESFVVEAATPSAVADSAVVSVTMPNKAQGLAAPSLTIPSKTSTSALLKWTPVAGASGYRVYWTDGFQTQNLGTVSSLTTSVTVTGLSAGSTGWFRVEAYRSSLIGDSAWVAVTTPAAAHAGDLLTLWASLGVQPGPTKHDAWQWTF